VRTTLTLDDDVAAKLRAAARRTGGSFREVVNETLRRGLAGTPSPRSRVPFVVKARDLGRLAPGVRLDNVGELLEQIEGPLHR
jgi:hypothetical protein